MVLSPESGTISVPAFPVEIVDTVGAGDAFNAGFICARQAGRSVAEAMRWGNAVAALKVSRAGARSAPRLEEVESFLRDHPTEGSPVGEGRIL